MCLFIPYPTCPLPSLHATHRLIPEGKKLPLTASIIRPGVNLVTNGKPGRVVVLTKENRQQQTSTVTTTTTTTTSAPLTLGNNNNTSPLNWLTHSYLFNGLPSNVFSLPSPLEWVGNTLSRFGGTVINHSRMGPHVLIG